MSTSAQIAANQQNAKRSSGPRSEEGKAISALNNFRHGFTGAFSILEWEDADQYDLLYGGLLDDHRPSNTTEHLLVKTMAQSYWLRQRALNLQEMCFNRETPMCDIDREKQLALYLRYQTTHDRAFSKALDQFQKLRAEKRKEEIGFESQQQKQAEQQAAAQRRHAQENRREAGEKRREAAEQRAHELHQTRIRLTEAQARRHEAATTIASACKTPHASPEAVETMAQRAA